MKTIRLKRFRNQRGFSTVQSGGLRDTGGSEGSFVREYGGPIKLYLFERRGS